MCYWVSFILFLFLVVQNVKSDECGLRTAPAIPLIHHGSQSRLAEWPWHVAIMHRRNLTDGEYACGGTIIASNYILTAAHCTYPSKREGSPNHQRVRVEPSEIFILAGISNLWQLKNAPQSISVAEINVHECYNSDTLECDIALLKLNETFVFTDYVKLINLWRESDEDELIVGQLGYVAGWGMDERGNSPNQLQHATMLIVSRDECKVSDSDYYTKYLYERRSFCAGFRNGTSPGAGDSGGGLYIKIDGRWMLRGIVSNGMLNRNLQLDTSQYIVFTDVAHFLEWVYKHTTEPTYDESTAQDNDGALRSINRESLSRLGEWPWHAAVMRRYMKMPPKYACGATIIASNYVLTMAYCMYPRTLARRLKPREIIIQTGVLNLRQPDPQALQQMQVSKIMLHEDFLETDPGYNDVALLKLVGKLFLTEYVNPICLWTSHADEELIVNRLGYIAGWGTIEDSEFSNQLKNSAMIIVSRQKCRNSDMRFYTGYLFDRRAFCAGLHNGTLLVSGHAGGGLYLEIDGRWVLRGILSSGKVDQVTGLLYLVILSIIYRGSIILCKKQL